MVDIDPQRHEIFPNFNSSTHVKFNIEAENRWLEEEFPFGMAYFQGLCLFQEG